MEPQCGFPGSSAAAAGPCPGSSPRKPVPEGAAGRTPEPGRSHVATGEIRSNIPALPDASRVTIKTLAPAWRPYYCCPPQPSGRLGITPIPQRSRMRPVLKRIRLSAPHATRRLGLFDTVARTHWRAQRLLILCYHAFARHDEHHWRPALYMTPALFEARMAALQRHRCTVLPLAEALQRLYSNDLPERSVALTFDDGSVDFYSVAYPILATHGYPATVYLTTYYCENQYPIFNLMCSYLLWKGRAAAPRRLGRIIGRREVIDLRTQEGRHSVHQAIVRFASEEGLSGPDRDALAAQIAASLGLDYAEMRDRRFFHLMNAAEVAQLARSGVDFQLHTHRHRSPRDRELFLRELRDNQERIERMTGSGPRHFCYPSGHYAADFLPWLREAKIVSAATCDWGLASPDSNPLLLPRLVDTGALPDVVFEGWLTGASDWLTPRRRHRPVAAT